jgi:hypothetical protein
MVLIGFIFNLEMEARVRIHSGPVRLLIPCLKETCNWLLNCFLTSVGRTFGPIADAETSPDK